MNLLVFDKTVVLAEGLATLAAFEWLLAGVDALMHYEGSRAAEGLPAPAGVKGMWMRWCTMR